MTKGESVLELQVTPKPSFFSVLLSKELGKDSAGMDPGHAVVAGLLAGHGA